MAVLLIGPLMPLQCQRRCEASWARLNRAIKTVMRWTGSNERTVKNWIAGTNGPSGEHLVILARHSRAVMTAFEQLSGRIDSNSNTRQVRKKLTEALELLDGTRIGMP